MHNRINLILLIPERHILPFARKAQQTTPTT